MTMLSTSTERKFMNHIQPSPGPDAPEDGSGDESNPALPSANGPASGAAQPVSPATPESPSGRRSRFLEKVYYWVLSRS
jgi:hypothetical protein